MRVICIVIVEAVDYERERCVCVRERERVEEEGGMYEDKSRGKLFT